MRAAPALIAQVNKSIAADKKLLEEMGPINTAEDYKALLRKILPCDTWEKGRLLNALMATREFDSFLPKEDDDEEEEDDEEEDDEYGGGDLLRFSRMSMLARKLEASDSNRETEGVVEEEEEENVELQRMRGSKCE